MTQSYDEFQRSGTEYGGVVGTPSGIQPQPGETFTAGDRLRLGYTTGNEDDWQSLEDRRQFLGLRPATGERPMWLGNISPVGDPRLDSYGSMAVEIQADVDQATISAAETEVEEELDPFWSEDDILS